VTAPDMETGERLGPNLVTGAEGLQDLRLACGLDDARRQRRSLLGLQDSWLVLGSPPSGHSTSPRNARIP
jgi:hypothetical protein